MTQALCPVREIRFFPLATSQRWIKLSSPPEATILPPGEMAMVSINRLWPPRGAAPSFPFVTSQRRNILSSPPEARVRPLGKKAREYTPPAWPARETGSLPPATSQRMIVPSLLPEASVSPPGEKDREETQLVCPFSGPALTLVWATSHRRIRLSWPPEASV